MRFNSGITVITGLGVRSFRSDGVEFIEFPENSLHPTEQVESMKRLVENYVKDKTPLNIKTNSPEIVQSIHLYMKKLGVFNDLHAGVVDKEGNLTDCGNDLDPVFEDLAQSFDFLMELRSDIENSQEEQE